MLFEIHLVSGKSLDLFPYVISADMGQKKECHGEQGSPCIFSCLVLNSRLRNHGPNVRQAARWTMERIQDKLK